MQLQCADGVLQLAHGALLRLDGAAACRLTALRGVLLVSQEGVATDEELRSGQSLTIARNGCVLVEAWGEAALRLERGAAPSAAWPDWCRRGR